MDLMEISKKRSTIRKYSNRALEKDKLEKILEAGRWAPTAINAQPQRILVLDTKESLSKVREFCTFSYDQKYVDLSKECDDMAHGKINLYYGAPVVLLVCYDQDVAWKHPLTQLSSGQTDATIVATHMMLEAASLDVGSAWISYFDEEKARELLNLPENWQPVCMLYLGYPADDFVVNKNLSHSRKPIEETCFFNEIPNENE